MRYSVHTIRSAGLQARWGRTRNGAPVLLARAGESEPWRRVDRDLWARMERDGIRAAFFAPPKRYAKVVEDPKRGRCLVPARSTDLGARPYPEICTDAEARDLPDYVALAGIF